MRLTILQSSIGLCVFLAFFVIGCTDAIDDETEDSETDADTDTDTDLDTDSDSDTDVDTDSDTDSDSDTDTTPEDCSDIEWGFSVSEGEVTHLLPCQGMVDSDLDGFAENSVVDFDMCTVHLTGKRCLFVVAGWNG